MRSDGGSRGTYDPLHVFCGEHERHCATSELELHFFSAFTKHAQPITSSTGRSSHSSCMLSFDRDCNRGPRLVEANQAG